MRNNNRAGLEEVMKIIDSLQPKPADTFFNRLLDFVCKNSYGIKFSEKLLEVMIKNKIKASLVTFNTLLDLYINNKNHQMAWHLFESLLKAKDPNPDCFTFSIMINGVKTSKKPDILKAVELFKMYKERLTVEVTVVNCLLDVYLTMGRKDLATALIKESKDVFGI